MSSRKSKSSSAKQVPKILEIEKDVKAALISDVEDFLKQFADGPLTYESFLQCYKEADFWTIFIGRISPADEYEVDILFQLTFIYESFSSLKTFSIM